MIMTMTSLEIQEQNGMLELEFYKGRKWFGGMSGERNVVLRYTKTLANIGAVDTCYRRRAIPKIGMIYERYDIVRGEFISQGFEQPPRE